MHLEGWESLSDAPLPYERFAWKTEAEAVPVNPTTIGTLVVVDLTGRRHRYQPFYRSWYDLLEDSVNRHRFIAATAAHYQEALGVFPFLEDEPVVPQVTAGRFAEVQHTTPQSRNYDDEVLILGSLTAAFEEHNMSFDPTPIVSTMAADEGAVEAARYSIEDCLDKAFRNRIATADAEGNVTELPSSQPL